MIKKLHLGGSSHIKDLHSVKSKKTLEEVKQPVTTETADISYSEYLKEHGVPIEGDTDYNKYLREHGVTEKPNAVKSYLRSKDFKKMANAISVGLGMAMMQVTNPFVFTMYKTLMVENIELKKEADQKELAKKTA